jgi:uncharacterized protein YbaR (Trm112 family)
MQADSNNKDLEAFQAWASELACPACLGPLRLREASVVCTACGRAYPVVDGIPVLIVERAVERT